MPIVLGTGFVLSTADEVPGTPWIGWHNVVSASPSNVTATTNVADSINLANPSTNLNWVGTSATEQYITVTTDPATTGEGAVDYLGVAKHNFGSAGIAVSVEGVVTNPAVDTQTKLLLHFDGNDNSTTFTDSSSNPKTFTAVGNAQLQTEAFKFGTAAGAFDGTGDWITTPDHADFNFGSNDFTIDCWFFTTAGSGGAFGIAGQVDSSETASTLSFELYRDGSNVITAHFAVNAGANTVTLAGTTQFTDALNTGWNHVAVTRSGTTYRLFLNGVLEDTEVQSGTSVNSTNALRIGTLGERNVPWAGGLDEFRMIVGSAVWTANFTPPTIAYPWVQLTSPTVPADDSPLMFRWDPATYYQMRLRMQAGTATPQAAVVYIGELLVCERSIDINVEHVPVTYGRRTHAVNGMSQSGEFLGRIVIGEHRETKAEFKWFQDTWWRASFDPFLEAAQEIPFFWAWSPEEYPAECGYVWLTNDAEASVDPVTRRVHTELVMEGVA